VHFKKEIQIIRISAISAMMQIVFSRMGKSIKISVRALLLF